MSTKYLFITGGVISSLGKGITAAAIGMLLERHGLRVALMKFDPYINVDPGTMNPFQHGEVYVTDDGAETDLDLGHYFRFTDSLLSQESSVSTGQIYDKVIKRERRGDYLGQTVQVIPHITNEIKSRITACKNSAEDPDVLICEIGGTVGDIESLPYLEAIRQFRYEQPKDCLNIHLTYVPFVKAAGETKTKPTQHSVQTLREIGIIPDILICRSEQPLDESLRDKISLHCSVPKEAVFQEVDVPHSIYEVPLDLRAQDLDNMICDCLGVKKAKIDLSDWEAMIEAIKNPEGELNIAVIGKYVTHQDAYKSIFQALQHSATFHKVKLNVHTISTEAIEEGYDLSQLKNIQGCLVPGGFGERGWEGKLKAVRYCRENKIPLLGICLGMQAICVEFARNVLGYEDACSLEMNPNSKHPVITLLSDQYEVVDIGGTLRKGSYPCQVKEGSLAHKAYGSTLIHERHRHRYEFNPTFREEFEAKGFVLSGTMNDKLVEMVEVQNHPFFIGVQFHPEFLSKPTVPHPLFNAFMKASIECLSPVS